MTTMRESLRSGYRRGARRRARLKSRLVAGAFLAPIVIYLAVFYAFPLYRNIDLSLRDYTLRSFIDGSAEFVGFANYLDVIASSTFWPAFANTAVFTLVSIGFQFAIGLALAIFFYRRLQNIPEEIYEAASLDGATGWQRFWRITFPLLRPVSAITLLLGLVYTLKVFDIIWIMTRGGPGDASATFAIWSYRLGFGGGSPDLSPAAAVANLLILVAFVFGFIYIRTQRKAVAS
jgi:ABC-type sugar transport system permease subunit